jgi:hypothetical protein
MDYVAEVLPVVVLMEPAKADIWGDPLTTNKQWVPGLGFSPIGFRIMWFSGKAFKPYFISKGGLLAFPQKVLSTDATYVNFSLQTGIGVQARLTQRTDLRLGLFSDFHFSNAFMVPVNPGLDVMNANFGLSYRLGKRGLKQGNSNPGALQGSGSRLSSWLAIRSARSFSTVENSMPFMPSA